jgi:hypothetical protein
MHNGLDVSQVCIHDWSIGLIIHESYGVMIDNESYGATKATTRRKSSFTNLPISKHQKTISTSNRAYSIVLARFHS